MRPDLKLPLFVLQPALARIARKVARQRPELFARLGPSQVKVFLIDPVDLPFVLYLRPRPRHPTLRALPRNPIPAHDARVAATLLQLLRMIDGAGDGDAMFFARDLSVSGDTEAVVSLRNALDDMDRSLAEIVAGMFGPPGRLALSVLRRKFQKCAG